MAFTALLVLSVVSLTWLHVTVMQLRQATAAIAPAQRPQDQVAEQPV
jgi:hypothetical protein